jgi:hypothetical protein
MVTSTVGARVDLVTISRVSMNLAVAHCAKSDQIFVSVVTQ